MNEIGRINNRVAVAGTHKSSPLEIHSSILLQPGTSLWILSAFPFQVYPCGDVPPPSKMFSESPVRIEVEVRSWLWPLVPLNSDFAKGWSNISTELKVEILGYILTFEEPISCPYVEDKGEFKQLFRLLHTTPEIAALSRHVFYSTNTITISMLTNDTGLYKMWYESGPGTFYRTPPRDTLRFLRKVTVVIGPFQEHWDRLNLLSDLKERCPNIQKLAVIFRWNLASLFGDDPIGLDDERIWLTGYGIDNWKVWSFSFRVDISFAGHPAYLEDDDWGDDGFSEFPADPAVEECLENAIRRRIEC